MSSLPSTEVVQPRPLFEASIVKRAVLEAFKKLNPIHQLKNPVMATVWLCSALTTLLFFQALLGHGEARTGFILAITSWLWFTLLFANFAEAMAEGRGKAQADSLRRSKKDVTAKRLPDGKYGSPWVPINATDLRIGDVTLVEAGDTIPADGEVVEGVASVNEAAITGESAPVIRESGGDRSAVTGGTRVLSDRIIVRITARQARNTAFRLVSVTASQSASFMRMARPSLVMPALLTSTCRPPSALTIASTAASTPAASVTLSTMPRPPRGASAALMA